MKAENLPNLKIARTIYSNSESSKKYFRQNRFIACFRRFLQIEHIKPNKVTIGTNNWDVKTYRNNVFHEVLLNPLKYFND